MKLSERKAVVTGGTGALGRVIVDAFVREGANVAVAVSSAGDATGASHWSEHIRESMLLFPCDATDRDSVDLFFRRVHEQWRSVDILFHTVGGYFGGTHVEDLAVKDWDRMLALNLTSAFLFSRAVLSEMRRQNYGRIVFVSAMSALQPVGQRAAYSVAKRGLVTLVEVLSEELKGTNVTANAIAPGTILTEANRRSMPNADVSTWVTPEEIAKIAVFLCSSEAQEVRGTIIRIPGAP